MRNTLLALAAVAAAALVPARAGAAIDENTVDTAVPFAAAIAAQAMTLAAPCGLRGPVWVADLAKAFEAMVVRYGGPGVTESDVQVLKLFASNKLAEAKRIMANDLAAKGAEALCRGYKDTFAFAAAEQMVTQWRAERDRKQ